MFKTILAAFDGSEHSRQALQMACDIAKRYDAALHIVHTPQLTGDTMMVGYSAVPVPPSAEELEKAGQKMLDQAVALAVDCGIDQPGTKVKDGDPGRVIVECAQAEGADLIVMGRRGLGQFGALLVGSTTHKVSQLADCAVLTVK